MNFAEISSNLKSLGYEVSCFDHAAEASAYLNSKIDNKTVGFGGSVTLDQLGLYEKLASHNELYWHWKLSDGQTADDVRAKANAAQIYLSSVNGIAESGEIVNIDGTCNRISSVLYRHEKVYLVLGENKIAKDYDAALYRARNIAAPLNAKRFNLKTPCVQEGGRCYNCKSPERICRGLSVLWQKPMAGEYEIVLIHENLGY